LSAAYAGFLVLSWQAGVPTLRRHRLGPLRSRRLLACT
jgi:hypothetical protein